MNLSNEQWLLLAILAGALLLAQKGTATATSSTTTTTSADPSPAPNGESLPGWGSVSGFKP